MFRAMTWWLLREGVDVHDPAAVAARGDEPRHRVRHRPAARPRSPSTASTSSVAIRSDEVNAACQPVSAVPEVRARLLELQRDVIGAGAASSSRAATSAPSCGPRPR